MKKREDDLKEKKIEESDLEEEIELSDLEENIKEISEEVEKEMEEDLDSETFEKFVGNWSMEQGSPSLERVASISSQQSSRDIENIEEVKKKGDVEKFRNYSPPQEKNYDVIADEEFRRYEIEQTGINAPTLTTIERDFSPKMINPFTDRNLIRETTEPFTFEVKRTETKKRLPFEKDEKYRR